MDSNELVALQDGWVRWAQPDVDADVLIRFAQQLDGRREAVEVRLSSPGGLTAEMLRRVSLSRAEAIANQRGGVAPPPAFRTPPRPSGPGTRIARDVPPTALVDRDEGGVLREDPRRGPERPKLRLRGATARLKPDTFYEEVAVRYSWLAPRSSRPAAELADANRVPVTTAHRWIKEARRRGYLAPGRKGRIG